MSTPYPAPVDQLLTFAIPTVGPPERWPDYAALGFAAEHVPELIRLMRDDELTEHGVESPELYAGVHAWRALGQMRAEPAIGALIAQLDVDDDWVREEVPRVLVMIGPATLEPLLARLPMAARDPDPWPAVNVIETLINLAARYPDARAAVVDAITRQLGWWGRQDEVVNTYLIHACTELKVRDAADLIRAVFDADGVDPLFGIDWEDVQVALGLLPERRTPRPGTFRGPFRPRPGRHDAAARAAAEARRRDKARKRGRKAAKKRR